MRLFTAIFSKNTTSKIRTKLTLVFSLLVGLVALSVFYYVPKIIEQKAIAAIEEKVQSITTMTAHSISAALFFNDVRAMKNVLLGTRQNKDIVYIAVTNDSGRIVTAYNEKSARKNDFINTHTLEDLSPADLVYKTVTTIKKSNAEIGELYLGVSLQDLREETKSSRKTIFLLSVSVFVAGIFIIFSISTIFTRPLSQMAETAEKITSGDLSQRAEIYSRDEAGILAEAFNTMLDHLETAQSSLLSANQNLANRAKDLRKEIQERKRAELALKKFATKLEQSNRSLQDFAYVASHDLQEPLRKVQAFGDRLKVKCGDALNEQGLDYLDRMQNAASRMQTLINDLLTYSRVTSQAKPFVDVDLNEVTQAVISDLETRIEDLSGQVQLDQLPVIEAEPVQMRQLMQNIIGNALKFHKPNETPIVKIHGEILKTPKKHPEEHSSDEFCQITIVDNGIGFEEKYADRIN